MRRAGRRGYSDPMKAFAPGQRWTYRTRPGEETSTLMVLGRDQSAAGQVAVSIRIEDIVLRPPIGGTITELMHAPIEETALRQSVTELLQEGLPLPSDLGSYETWRLEFEKGGAGAFDLPLADTLDLIDRAAEHQPPSLQHPLFRKTNVQIIAPFEEEETPAGHSQGRGGQA